jgi:hypothetical protein
MDLLLAVVILLLVIVIFLLTGNVLLSVVPLLGLTIPSNTRGGDDDTIIATLRKDVPQLFVAIDNDILVRVLKQRIYYNYSNLDLSKFYKEHVSEIYADRWRTIIDAQLGYSNNVNEKLVWLKSASDDFNSTKGDYNFLLQNIGKVPASYRTLQIYKIHLMPEEKETETVLYRLIQILKNNTDLIAGAKIITGTEEELREGNLPRVVIYCKGKPNAQKILDIVFNTFKDMKGTNRKPRYNEKVTSLIYWAQGDGDFKGISNSFLDESLVTFKSNITGTYTDYRLINPNQKQIDEDMGKIENDIPLFKGTANIFKRNIYDEHVSYNEMKEKYSVFENAITALLSSLNLRATEKTQDYMQLNFIDYYKRGKTKDLYTVNLVPKAEGILDVLSVIIKYKDFDVNVKIFLADDTVLQKQQKPRIIVITESKEMVDDLIIISKNHQKLPVVFEGHKNFSGVFVKEEHFQVEETPLEDLSDDDF